MSCDVMSDPEQPGDAPEQGRRQDLGNHPGDDRQRRGQVSFFQTTKYILSLLK